MSSSASSGGGGAGGGAGSTSSSGSVAHLTNSALPLVALRDYYRAELAQLLTLPSHTSASATKKALVLDKSLSGPLGLVSEVSFLQSHGVEQIHHLKDPDLVTPANHIMYFVRPILANMRIIASHILNQRAREPSVRRTYSVFFVPRKSMLCEKELEQLGVLGDIRHMEEFHFELIPFEEDVLSMEMSSAFKDTFLDGDPTSLLYMARSLMKLQSLVGLIPTIKGKGNNAFKLYSLLQRLRREGGFNIGSSGSQANVSSEIDSLILIDRSVDFVTPLLTQLTYEGLIDEIFGIKNSYIDVDADMIGGNKPANPPAGGSAPPPASGPKKLLLNSVDTLFKETRDLNFRVLGPLLHKKAEYIKDTYSERHSAQTVTEMHSFMQRFKTAHAEHNLLQTHINLAERISNQFKSKLFDRKLEIERWCLDGNETDACEEYVEACICKQEPMVAVLRLMCLVSLTQGGLKQKKFEHWKREFLHTYGFQHLFTLNNLEKLGMFTCNSSLKLINQGGRGWANLRKGLKLTTPSEKVDISNPTDFNYIFNGYAPLSVRLIEIAHKPGWRRFEELLGFVPGKSFEFRQEASAATLAVPAVNLLETKTANTPTAQNPGGLAGLAALAGGATTAPPEDRKDATSAAGANGTRKKPLTLVCFLGGVSMSEISALRYLSEREDHGRDYIICTTKLINGATFVDSLQEQIINKLNGGAMPPPGGRAGAAAAAASRR